MIPWGWQPIFWPRSIGIKTEINTMIKQYASTRQSHWKLNIVACVCSYGFHLPIAATAEIHICGGKTQWVDLFFCWRWNITHPSLYIPYKLVMEHWKDDSAGRATMTKSRTLWHLTCIWSTPRWKPSWKANRLSGNETITVFTGACEQSPSGAIH